MDTDPVWTVMILLEAKPGSEKQLKEALLEAAEKSREEASCLAYFVQQDTTNPCKFGLYERWVSKELHEQQFSKPYIRAFAAKAEPLLLRPYDGLFGWELEKADV